MMQQTVWLQSLRLRLSGSFNAAVIAGIRARGQSCLPSGPMDAPSSSAALVYPPAHTHTSTGPTTTKHTTIKPNLDRKAGPTMNEERYLKAAQLLSMKCAYCNEGCSVHQRVAGRRNVM